MIQRPQNLSDAPKIFFISMFATSIIGGLFSALKISGDGGLFISYAIPQIINILTVILYLRFRKINFFNMTYLSKNIMPKRVGLSVLFVVSIMMMNYLLVFISLHIGNLLNIKMEVTVPQMNNLGSILLGTLIICVLPAIGEELLFRGCFMSSLSELGTLKSILLSGLIFSLMHLNPAQMIHQFILGCLLSYILILTKNIIYPIIIHFVNNFLALFLEKLFPGLSWLYNFGILQILILFIMCIIGIFMVVKVLNEFKNPMKVKEKVVYPDGKLAYYKMQFTVKLKLFLKIFKRGGMKDIYNHVNIELSRHDKEVDVVYPSDKYWLYAIMIFLAIMTIITFISSFGA